MLNKRQQRKDSSVKVDPDNMGRVVKCCTANDHKRYGAGGYEIDNQTFDKLMQTPGKICATARDSALVVWPEWEYGIWLLFEYLIPA